MIPFAPHTLLNIDILCVSSKLQIGSSSCVVCVPTSTTKNADFALLLRSSEEKTRATSTVIFIACGTGGGRENKLRSYNM